MTPEGLWHSMDNAEKLQELQICHFWTKGLSTDQFVHNDTPSFSLHRVSINLAFMSTSFILISERPLLYQCFYMHVSIDCQADGHALCSHLATHVPYPMFVNGLQPLTTPYNPYASHNRDAASMRSSFRRLIRSPHPACFPPPDRAPVS